MKIYISGLYSGTNPQPGVGIARSLRQAYPDATIVGVEYSTRCSGIHWQDFDEIWLQRPWDELNFDLHAAAVKEILDAGGLWISAIDLEIMWFGSIFPDGHPNLLTPPLGALEQVVKPAVAAHKGLPVEIPVFCSTELPDWDLHAFCRKHDWKVWLKGPYYEAVRIRTWADLDVMRNVLSTAWATEKLFLQSHVTGYEESITLSAYRGKLIEAVSMRKRDLTELSKTWAGDVTPIPEDFRAPLEQTIRNLNWTGGAEIEMVRDAGGKLWLLEVNPRFPAWIHGSTIAGFNLPAVLVEAATGIPAVKPTEISGEFTRVVLEIPVKSQFPLAPLPEPFAGGVGHSLKHPSGLVEFANRLHKLDNGNPHTETVENQTAVVPPSMMSDVNAVNFARVETPSFLFMERTASELFDRAAKLSARMSTERVAVTNAYSMKTNPDARLVQLAYNAGFLAEGISPLELNKAIEVGFRPDQLVLNGPGKWWHQEFLPREPIHAVFADSIADLRRMNEAAERGELQSKIFGVRLRTPQIASRFGIPVDTPENFEKLINAVKTLPSEAGFGVHFHMASSNVGVGQWWTLFQSMLRWCQSVESLSGRKIELLDVGGGWFPDDTTNGFEKDFSRAVKKVEELLPSVRQIISEPGKAMAQPSMALAMRILEIQDSETDAKEVVVDGSIAELPMYFFYPHRILHQNADTKRWQTLRHGKSHFLGRLCMEHDIVAANVELPTDAKSGDLLVFCDAGAYDRSMSYNFGRG